MILEGSLSRAQQLHDDANPVMGVVDDTSPFSRQEMDNVLSSIASLDLNLGDTEASDPKIISPNPANPAKTTQQGFLEKISALAKQEKDELTQREWATIISLGMMYNSLPLDSSHLLGACAMLLHTVILRECKLTERAITQSNVDDGEGFLNRFSKVIFEVLTSDTWKKLIARIPCYCDLGDAVDGRVFLGTLSVLQQAENVTKFSVSVRIRLQTLMDLAQGLFDVDFESHLTRILGEQDEDGSCLPSAKASKKRARRTTKRCDHDKSLTVLPFKNPTIDAHLQPVSVKVGDSNDEAVSSNMSRIFQELSHWHNHKRLLNARLIAPLTPWQQLRNNRRNQFFMTDVTRYAASLTNSVGGSLKPETIFLKQLEHSGHQGQTNSVNPAAREGASSGRIRNDQKAKPAKREQFAAGQETEQGGNVDKHLNVWKRKVTDFEREHDYSARYIRAKQYLADLPPDKRKTFGIEVQAYMLSTLVLVWKERCRAALREASMPIMALIWSTIQQIAKAKDGITHQIADCIQATIKTFKLPRLEVPRHEKRKMSFNFAVLDISTVKLDISLPSMEFQLLHGGPYMDRSMGSAPDSRIQHFEPDTWQRQVLDEIDARRSLFVVAPTSAGKTFIS